MWANYQSEPKDDPSDLEDQGAQNPRATCDGAPGRRDPSLRRASPSPRPSGRRASRHSRRPRRERQDAFRR